MMTDDANNSSRSEGVCGLNCGNGFELLDDDDVVVAAPDSCDCEGLCDDNP